MAGNNGVTYDPPKKHSSSLNLSNEVWDQLNKAGIELNSSASELTEYILRSAFGLPTTYCKQVFDIYFDKT